MKIRHGFVSNSSSSSFVVINALTDEGFYIRKLKENLEGTQLVVDRNFGETKFGWSSEEYYDFGSKVIFAYLQANYLADCEFINSPECIKQGKRWLAMLEKVLKDKLKITDIVWNITTQYGEKAEGKDHAYIDHQSASIEGSNTEMFDSEESLTNFLFNPTSYIQTGNDN